MTTPVIRRRKKPIEVDTIQWTGHNEADVQAFTGGPAVFYALDAEDREGSDDPEATATVYDKLHSTWILVYTGQHIVRGVKGEHHPIAEDVLAETYDEPTDQTADLSKDDLDQLAANLEDKAEAISQLNETVTVLTERAERAEADVARLRLGEEPGWDPATYPTPGQWIARFNAAAPAERFDAASWAIGDAQRATACFYENHKGQLAERRRALVLLVQARALYKQWAKAGPPPLGTSVSRWWDARLAELHATIRPPEQQSEAESQS